MASSDYTDLQVGSVRDLGKIINLGAYWRDVRFENNAVGKPVYRGVNYFHNADTAATDWEIWKYTWDGSSYPLRIEGPLPGSWDDRAGLNWG